MSNENEMVQGNFGWYDTIVAWVKQIICAGEKLFLIVFQFLHFL